MSEDTELKPCPFCGGKATRRQKEFRHVSCENPRCDVVAEAGAFFGNEQEAIAAWNTRPGEQAAVAQAVEAERTRVVGELNARRQTAAITESYARNDLRLQGAMRCEAQVEAYDVAIVIVKGKL